MIDPPPLRPRRQDGTGRFGEELAAWVQRDGTTSADVEAAGRPNADVVSGGVRPTPIWRAILAGQVRPAARILRTCSDGELEDLDAQTLELPTIDTSLQLPLPGC